MTDTDTDIVWRGPDKLRPLLVPIDSLDVQPDNVNEGDVPATRRSLGRFGQRYPSVIRTDTGTYVAGSTRHMAAIELGWTHIAVVDADDLSDDEARAFAIADNRTARLGSFDELALIEQLDTLDDDLLAALSYDDDDLAQLLDRIIDADDETPLPSEPGGQPTGNVVPFKLGDIQGQIATELYHELAAEYERRRTELGADVMLEDVIVDWLAPTTSGGSRSSDDEWYTPSWLFDALGLRFNIDVASPADREHVAVPAKRWYTESDDGLAQPWRGLVFCNPPYSNAAPWARRMIEHGNGVLLAHVPMNGAWALDIWRNADAVCLFQGMNFVRPDGSLRRPAWWLQLAAFGDKAADAVRSLPERLPDDLDDRWRPGPVWSATW